MTRVAVLLGGLSNERAVSLVTGQACVKALRDLGHDVVEIDMGHNVADQLIQAKPDIVFNALHGRFGEDGCVQGVLEILGIPYTHSGVMASAMAMDKPVAKRLFAAEGLPVAPDALVTRADFLRAAPMAPPYVVKPANEGSSVGVALVMPGDNGVPDILSDDKWAFGDHVMVERFIPGRELSVAVMDSRALGVVELDPKGAFYDYASKYEEGGSQHTVPARVPDAIYAQACEYAEIAHRALGCRGVSRADFRFDDTTGQGEGQLVILEVNTQPGMTPTSLVPEIAAYRGKSFAQVVQWLVEDASCGR